MKSGEFLFYFKIVGIFFKIYFFNYFVVCDILVIKVIQREIIIIYVVLKDDQLEDMEIEFGERSNLICRIGMIE